MLDGLRMVKSKLLGSNGGESAPQRAAEVIRRMLVGEVSRADLPQVNNLPKLP
jgi:hypothetical protein